MEQINHALDTHQIVLLTGPQRCGKGTLIRRIAGQRCGHLFDLSDPVTALDPKIVESTTRGLQGLCIFKEIQLLPERLHWIRSALRDSHQRRSFLLVCSAMSVELRQFIESLAGEIKWIHMSGLAIHEVDSAAVERVWLCGGYPQSFMAGSDEASMNWRTTWIHSHLESIVSKNGFRIPAAKLKRFWHMLVHVHGSIPKTADLARSMGVKEKSVKSYLRVLDDSFLIRRLLPCSCETGKRLIKSPKLTIRDSGLLHATLGITNRADLFTHPCLALSWQGFALEQVIHLTGSEQEARFYQTHAGARLDLVIQKDSIRIGFDFQFRDTPKTTKSMHCAIQDLSLARLVIVFPGRHCHQFSDKISAIPLTQIRTQLQQEHLIFSSQSTQKTR
jgi:hypothetical protein